MLEDYFGLVEMVFSFGILIVFCVWQLWSTEKARKRLHVEEERSRLDTQD